jgi:hypothetical protein
MHFHFELLGLADVLGIFASAGIVGEPLPGRLLGVSGLLTTVFSDIFLPLNLRS